MDCIQLTNIRGYGYTGALPEEQVLGQWFEVDLIVWVALEKAGQSDRLEDTLDYREIIAQVQQLVETSRFALLERLASAIAESVLAFERITQVQVKLTKPAAPIPNFGGKITIDITRQRTSNQASRAQ
ncbi:dihydroneopterin aldolase [Myxacorys almedinensis]|uniref:7,8-dihydroneopterin aldolase n=1 Tax=Myxacorys almedinensis A TaxID=2690445 RepID=A0A8J7Z399_9CYAN|nr:dihydroneopterin aldolase [Myxacorys almedinensis]NDJ18939.1 dihydroneopterin aldolase [Myxacorys almedinensis A]